MSEARVELGCEPEEGPGGGVGTVLGRFLVLRALREIEKGDEANGVELETVGQRALKA